MKKRFIEYDLPLKEISHYSAKEKYIRHGHPSTLHLWWARRPLAASRASIFASLIDDPGHFGHDQRSELFDLIARISPWDAVKTIDSNDIHEARKKIFNFYGRRPKVLDPFAGGGSIPLECMRLGCETYSSDYNPVAVFIQYATLNWPLKFNIKVDLSLYKNNQLSSLMQSKLYGEKNSNEDLLLAFLVKKWANIIFQQAKEEVGKFYTNIEENEYVYDSNHKKNHNIPIGYLWVRTIPCQNPSCNAEIPLARQFWLSKKKNKKIAFRPIITNNKITFKILSSLNDINKEKFDPNQGTVSRGNVRCLICGQVIKATTTRKLAKEGKMGKRLVIVISYKTYKKGKYYRIANKTDIKVYKESKDYLYEKIRNWPFIDSPLPTESIPVMSGTFNAPIYGIDSFDKLFNNRQKLSLITFLEKTKNCDNDIRLDCEFIINSLNANLKNTINVDELHKAVIGYVAIIFDRCADKGTTLTRWHNSGEKIEATFSRQALPMVWDFVEINFFSGANGDWVSNTNWVLKYLSRKPSDSTIECTIRKESALNLQYPNEYFDAVFTDPPYYNSVPYADLSDFFYVWLKKILGDKFSELFKTPLSPKTEEITEMAGWDRIRYAHKDKQFFEDNITKALHEIYRVLKNDSIFVIIYAHKTTDGWETMLNGLISSGFVVTASWPIHTEMTSRLRAAASATLASSIYIICRKKNREEIGFWTEIKDEIQKKVEKKLQQFWEEGIVGGDFMISAIGPGMETFSKYNRVETYSGKIITTVELLKFIRSIVTNYVITQLLSNGQEISIDKEAQFYLAYRWTYMDNEVQYDDARKLASAMGVYLEDLTNDSGFIQKKGKFVKVLNPKERGIIETPSNLVDIMNNAVLLWEKGSNDKLEEFLSKTGYGRSDAFWQFCQAISESLLPGYKEKQLLEGLLIGRERYSDIRSHNRTQKELGDFVEE